MADRDVVLTWRHLSAGRRRRVSRWVGHLAAIVQDGFSGGPVQTWIECPASTGGLCRAQYHILVRRVPPEGGNDVSPLAGDAWRPDRSCVRAMSVLLDDGIVVRRL